MTHLDLVILTLNAGSSSLKFAAFRLANGGEPSLLASGQIEGIGARQRLRQESLGRNSRAQFRPLARAASITRRRWAPFSTGSRRRATILRSRRSAIASCTAGRIIAEPVLIDDATLAKLQGAHSARAAPPAAQCRRRRSGDEGLPVDAASRVLRHRFPSQPSFVDDTYALPRSYYDEGVRRYGFHGLSYEFITRKLRTIAPQIAREDVIIAHLGNGASMCAVHDGRAVATTMGFTALDGLVDGHPLRTDRSGRGALSHGRKEDERGRDIRSLVEELGNQGHVGPFAGHARARGVRQPGGA